jgi:hypothetical protein
MKVESQAIPKPFEDIARAFLQVFFRGRADVFAYLYKGGDGKNYYQFECSNIFNPSFCGKSRKFKGRKVPCAECKCREFRPVNQKDVYLHLRGEKPIGCYPLVPQVEQDESVIKNAAFLAALDIDDHENGQPIPGKDARRDMLKLHETLRQAAIPHLVERSKSATGFHIWIILDKALRVSLLRAVILTAVRKSGIVDKGYPTSFDRMFPTQDELKNDQDLGNLILTPLCNRYMPKGGALFLDPDKGLEPYPMPKQKGLILDLAGQLENGGGPLVCPVSRIEELAREWKIDETKKKRLRTKSAPMKLPTPDAPDEPLKPYGAQTCLDHCAFLQHCRNDSASLSEPRWMAMISNLCRFSDGAALVHELSQGYPAYSPSETDAKITHLAVSSGPVTCAVIQEEGFDGCPEGGCEVKAPAVLAITHRTERIDRLIEQLAPADGGAPSDEILGQLMLELSQLGKDDLPKYKKLTLEKLPTLKLGDLDKTLAALRKRRQDQADGLPGYRIEDNGYRKKRVTESGEVFWDPLTNFVINLETDKQYLDEVESQRRIEGHILTEDNARCPFYISGRDFNNNPRFAEAIGEQGGVSCRFWNRDVSDVRRASQELSKPTSITAYTRIGFLNEGADRFFTPSVVVSPAGIAKNTDTVIDLSDVEHARHLDFAILDEETFLTTCRHIVDDLLDLTDHFVTYPLAGHTFISPFLSRLDASPLSSGERCILWVTGLTGSSKSFAALRFANFFGGFHVGKSVNSWTSTPYQVQKVGHHFADGLYLVDDFKAKNLSGRTEQVTQILQAYADGRGRGRLNSDASVKATYVIRGNLLVTGEDLPDYESSNLARMIVIHTSSREKDTRRGRACLKHQVNYRGVTPAFLHFVISRPGWFDDLIARIDYATDHFHQGIEEASNGLRIARNYALNQVGFDLFAEFLCAAGTISEKKRAAMIAEHGEILLASLDEHVQRVVDEQADSVFLSVLADLLQSGRAVLHEPGRTVGGGFSERDARPEDLRNVIGFLKPGDGHAYVYPKLAVGEVQKSLRDTGGWLGFSVKAIGKQLAAEGYLVDSDALRTTTVVRHEGKLNRVWKIRKRDLGLETVEESDDAPW